MPRNRNTTDGPNFNQSVTTLTTASPAVNKTRGRELFYKAKPLLQAISAVLRIVPRPLAKWMWVLSDWLPELPGVAFRYCLLKRLAKQCGDNVLVGRGV